MLYLCLDWICRFDLGVVLEMRTGLSVDWLITVFVRPFVLTLTTVCWRQMTFKAIQNLWWIKYIYKLQIQNISLTTNCDTLKNPNDPPTPPPPPKKTSDALVFTAVWHISYPISPGSSTSVQVYWPHRFQTAITLFMTVRLNGEN